MVDISAPKPIDLFFHQNAAKLYIYNMRNQTFSNRTTYPQSQFSEFSRYVARTFGVPELPGPSKQPKGSTRNSERGATLTIWLPPETQKKEFLTVWSKKNGSFVRHGVDEQC